MLTHVQPLNSLVLTLHSHVENMTVTRGENVDLHCPLSKEIASKNYIIQWKQIRSHDDHLVLSINGKIPQSLVHVYKTEFNHQTNTLQLSHVQRTDSTSYICEIFETQTILCQYNLVVLSKSIIAICSSISLLVFCLCFSSKA
jgi:hypothetical protein